MAAIPNTVFLDDSTLSSALNGALQSCPELVSALYESYYRYVLRVCRHFFRRHEDAEDAAAEVFLKLHTVLKNEERPLRFRPWLSKVTGRHCIDKLRKRESEVFRCSEEVEFDGMVDRSIPSPLSQVLLRERQQVVRRELRRLPRQYRILLVLHYYRQMSYAEIAGAVGCQLPTIKTAIFRAKKLLRARLLAACAETMERTGGPDRAPSLLQEPAA